MRITRFAEAKYLAQSPSEWAAGSGLEPMPVELQSPSLLFSECLLISSDSLQTLSGGHLTSFSARVQWASEELKHLLKVTHLAQLGARICPMSKPGTAWSFHAILPRECLRWWVCWDFPDETTEHQFTLVFNSFVCPYSDQHSVNELKNTHTRM